MMDKGKLEEGMAQENILEIERTFRTITDSVFDSIILINDRGEISFWNLASERMVGYKSSEALETNVVLFGLAPAPLVRNFL